MPRLFTFLWAAHYLARGTKQQSARSVWPGPAALRERIDGAGHPATWRASRPVRSGLRLRTPAPLAPALRAVNSPRADGYRTQLACRLQRSAWRRSYCWLASVSARREIARGSCPSPPRRVTAVPKVYHQRNWAWG